MSVSFYTVQYNKPEFRDLQFSLIKKYCKDNFNYIVINNGKDESNVKDINNFCRINNLTEIKTFQDRIPNTQDHSRALKYIYDEYLSKDSSDYRVVIDSDIFPFGDFKISDVMEDYQVAGIRLGHEPFYLSSFITIFNKEVNLHNISINIEANQDATMWTYGIKSKYKVKWLNHSTQGSREIYYIFKNIPDIIEKYKCYNNNNITFQLIEPNLLHYWQGSGWNNGNKNFHDDKFDFIKFVIENVEVEKLVLDNNVFYNRAIIDEWLHPELYKLNNLL